MVASTIVIQPPEIALGHGELNNKKERSKSEFHGGLENGEEPVYVDFLISCSNEWSF
jgi:hypothetical protein